MRAHDSRLKKFCQGDNVRPTGCRILRRWAASHRVRTAVVTDYCVWLDRVQHSLAASVQFFRLIHANLPC